MSNQNTINVITGTINILGNDLMLDSDGDLILNTNGDFYTTEDAEYQITDLPYRGYVCLNETIYRTVEAIKGSYPFDSDFGADIPTFVSRTVTPQLIENIKVNLITELIKDDRIKEVRQIDVEFQPPKTLIVSIFVVPIGQNETSQFVFPYYI
jgi:hypothetical protein